LTLHYTFCDDAACLACEIAQFSIAFFLSFFFFIVEKDGNSPDKLRHTRFDAYSVELVLLNKHQISGGGAYPDCYRKKFVLRAGQKGDCILTGPYIDKISGTGKKFPPTLFLSLLLFLSFFFLPKFYTPLRVPLSLTAPCFRHSSPFFLIPFISSFQSQQSVSGEIRQMTTSPETKKRLPPCASPHIGPTFTLYWAWS